MKVLITGAAGFIGMHVAHLLLARGDEVVGVDSLNDYYDVNLKKARLARLARFPGFKHVLLDISDRDRVATLFAQERPHCVLNLAAQAGVRYSLVDPYAYIDTNLVGFANILEGCRHNGVEHLVYASSSSVYGGNTKMPFSEHDNIDHPVSLYAATKKANELMAHSYSHLFGLPTTGLRFFTVYGPWGRPDMALFLFAKAIIDDQPIDIFNHGKMRRDFTYIDDVAEATVRAIDRPATAVAGFLPSNPDPATSWAPYRVFNIGNHAPVELMDYVSAIETALGKIAKKNFLPLPACDVPATSADTSEFSSYTGFSPATPVEEGVRKFVEWFREYYRT